MSQTPEARGAARWVVVLAGGVGSRFWPVSTPERPKQLLPLVSSRPMLRETVDRLSPVAPPSRTLVLTSASLAPAVRAMLPELSADHVVEEPTAAGTAAALTWAAHQITARASRDAVMLSVHADWAIGDPERFRAALAEAADAAEREHALVTVGVVPRAPDTGLGYIEPGAVVRGALRRVARFVEKPDRARAEALVAAGCLWNSGIFAWRAGDLLDEIRAHCPEVADALAAHADDREAFFGAVRAVAIDVGLLERSDRVLVLPGEFGWSDVGTWAALRGVRAADAHGNVPAGTAWLHEAHRNVVHADGTAVVLYGVDDLVVVATRGVTLVTTVERAADLKALLDALPREMREMREGREGREGRER
ncbi:MAG TPA: sugar phosphate nucleotidyltransferase [Gemmatimonadaceae bacterium]|nr:sugar phosphate nucleotidyltransferase [Gemmatimonadaceae bacterium]